MSQWEKAERNHCMESRLGVGEGQEVGREPRKAVCLVDKSPDEDGHQDQHPYFASRGRLHVQGRMLVLVRIRV